MDKIDDSRGAQAPAMQFAVDQLIGGKYRVLRLLGLGGMGSVYLVHQIFLGKELALKTIHQRCLLSDISTKRFQQEAKAASLLNHPSLVSVHDFGFLENGEPFLVMDFVDGITLADRLKQGGPMDFEEACSIFSRVCLGLSYAHDQGVVHRDIKPGNIMLVSGAALGAEGSVKVVDFGIAKLTGTDEGEIQALTRTGEIFGSPLYMSPEQCGSGLVDRRSDVYSLGCVIFESLTGAPPFVGQNALATMMMHQSDLPLSLKEASLGREQPEAVERIVAKMLRKSPCERYDNLGIVANELMLCRRAALAGDPEQCKLVETPKPEPRRSTGVSIDLRQLIALMVAATLFGVLLGVFGDRLVLGRSGASKEIVLRDTDYQALDTRPSASQIIPRLEPDGSYRVGLDYCDITPGVMQRLAAISGLKNVSASAAIFVGAGTESMFSNLKDLEVLDLSSTTITDNTLKALAKLPKLRYLNLDGVLTVTNEGLRALQGSSIRKLRLKGTNIDRSTLEIIAGYKKLQVLSLQGTAMGVKDVAALAGSLPNCEIEVSDSAGGRVPANVKVQR
jgi:serine/threonine protein kinase